MSERTIFERIIAGEIPCHKLYEDEHVFCFLDIAPLSEGHALVIPKEAEPTLDKLSDESAAAIGRVRSTSFRTTGPRPIRPSFMSTST